MASLAAKAPRGFGEILGCTSGGGFARTSAARAGVSETSATPETVRLLGAAQGFAVVGWVNRDG